MKEETGVVRAEPKDVQARSSWPFGGDHVMKATSAMPEGQRELVRWLFFHSIETGVAMKDAADAIRYDSSTVYRVLKGEYEGNLANVCEAIEGYKRIIEQRADVAQAGFVETETAKRIWKICDAAVTYESIAMIWGDPQNGKTWALQEYQRRHNHGATKYVRMPSAAGVQLVCREFAEACGLSSKCAFDAMRARIYDAIDHNTLVIVDEIHQAFNTYQKHARVSVLEMIREIHDRTGCGLVLCGTNVGRDEIEKGQHKLLLEQLRRRGIFKLQLPQHAPWTDRVAIAASYGLDAPEGAARETVDEIVCSSGLRAYTSYLRAATKLAKKRGQKIAWKHVQDAYETVKNYSRFG